MGANVVTVTFRRVEAREVDVEVQLTRPEAPIHRRVAAPIQPEGGPP